MVGGVFYTSCVAGRVGGPAETSAQKVAIEVAGTPIYSDAVFDAVAAQKSYQAQFIPGGMGPESELGIYQKVVQDAVESAVKTALVQASGTPLTDEALTKAFTDSVDTQIEMTRSQFVASGKLKPDAPDTQFDEVFKKEGGTGKTVSETKTDAFKQFKLALGDKEKRNGIVMGLALVLLQNQAAQKLALTDSDLEKNYDQYTVKRIITKDLVPGKGKPEERIAKAEAALKAGSTFEKAIDDFSEDLPNGGKRLSEVTSTLTGYTLLTDPAFKPLLNLKAGEVSPVVKLPEGEAIYKVVSIKSDPPKDFKTRKDFYKRQVIHDMTQKDVDAMVEKFKNTPGNVKFVAPGLKLVYDYQQAQQGTPTNGKSLADEMKDLNAEAKKVIEAGGMDARPATLVRYGALNFLWNTPGTDKTALRPDLIDTLKAILDRTEIFSVRMKLVDVYTEDKKYDDAVAQLVSAVENNRQDASGVINDKQITDTLRKMVAAKQVTAEQQKTVEDAQKAWKVQADEIQKQKDEVAKARKAEEDAAKAAEEKAKKDAAPKGPIAPPATGSKPGTTTVTPPVNPNFPKGSTVPPTPGPTKK